MRITELHIANFKAIERVSLIELSDVIVIAGPNGSGKSTIFDAIKFWKSSIGSYQRDELKTWLTELGMSEQQDALLYAHQNKEMPFTVTATVKLTDKEKTYLIDNAESILAFYYYKMQVSNAPYAPPILNFQNLDLIEDFRVRKEGILQHVQANLRIIANEESLRALTGTVEVGIDGTININAPLALKIVLSTFVPTEVGFIDYYGPQRNFGRENVQNLSLNVDQQGNYNRQNSTLYNHNQKYTSVKNELASSYVKRLIAANAGEDEAIAMNLERTVQELFNQFIPGKSFEGIVPKKDGSLSFNVITAAGAHDLNDLSSGEKELIYGYLKLQNSGLKSSVILIDEPELHLNPRLTDGLPDFYYRHLGRPMDNQLWLVTHSDTILRQSVGFEGFKVFHLQAVGSYPVGETQVIEVTAEDEVNRAVIDLVGDLAGYKPGGRLVILEGGGDSEFDLQVVERLFPEFAQTVNLVSSESRGRVQALHEILDRLGTARGLFTGVFSIVDEDNNPPEFQGHNGRYSWNAYHIENYLLEPRFIRQVLHENFLLEGDADLDVLVEKLRVAAESTKSMLVRHTVETQVRRTLMGQIKVTTRRPDFDAEAVSSLVERSVAAVAELSERDLSREGLEQIAANYLTKLDEALASDEWLRIFKGRDVLRAFVQREYNGKISYEALRNQIIARMRDARYQPPGMHEVLAAISASNGGRDPERPPASGAAVAARR